MKDLVRRVVREARVKLGGQKNLLTAIAPAISPQTYGTQVVSAWEGGRANMPAYVLLAVAQAGRISLDELLFGESMTSRQDRLEVELKEIRRLVETRALPAAGAPLE